MDRLNQLKTLFKTINHTLFHPQWMANHYHYAIKKQLISIENSVVLNVGSGDAELSTYLADSNRLVNLDYPTTASRYLLKPQVFADARQLPIAQQSVDVVLLFEVLEHIDNDNQVLAEIHHVLKKGGQCYLSIPFTYPLHDKPYDFRRYTEFGLCCLLEQHAFTIERLVSQGNSIVTALQMLNLALLDGVKSLQSVMGNWALVFALLVYPICLVNNLLAWLLIRLNWQGNLHLGYFAIVKKK